MNIRKFTFGLTLFALVIIQLTAGKRSKNRNKPDIVGASENGQENGNSDLSLNATQILGGMGETDNTMTLPILSNATQHDLTQDARQRKKAKKAHRLKHRRAHHKRKHLKRTHKRPNTDEETPELQTAGILESVNGEVSKDVNGAPLHQQRGRNLKKAEKHHQRQLRRLHRRKQREHKRRPVSHQEEAAAPVGA